MTVNTSKSPDGKAYRVAYDLSWTAANNLAHGSFTVDGLFTVGVGLTDQSVTAGSAWNGKTLTKAGAGTLVLTGDNRYTGGTRNTAGVLQIGDGGLTGSILGDVVNDGTLVLNRAGALTLAGHISGAGGLRQIGAGTVTLTGDNSYGGGTELRAGACRCRAMPIWRGIRRIGLHRRLAGDDGGLRHQPVGDAVADRRNRRRGRHDAGDERPAVRAGQPAQDRRRHAAADQRGQRLRRHPGARRHADRRCRSISGGIGNAATVVFEQTTDARYGGDIGALDGARRMIKRGAGTLTLGGMSALGWSIEAGGLVTSAERLAGDAAIASGAC